MERLFKGFLKFRTEVFGKKKELFTRLSETHAPRTRFITCSDARVDIHAPYANRSRRALYS